MYTFIPRKQLISKVIKSSILGVALFAGVFFFFLSDKLGTPPPNEPLITKIESWPKKQEALRTALENRQLPQVLGISSEPITNIPVLLYHGITEDGGDSNVSIEQFTNQMFYLKEQGWNTITVYDYFNFLAGQREITQKTFLLTFDDGRKDSYYYADPVLEKLGYHATMFVITGLTNKSDFHLTSDELAYMSKTGRWDIESHSKNGHSFITTDSTGTQGHYLTNKMWIPEKNRTETDEEFISRISTDIIESRRDIKKWTGQQSYFFAFPYGDYGQENLVVVKFIFLILQKEFSLMFGSDAQSLLVNSIPASIFRGRHPVKYIINNSSKTDEFMDFTN